MTTVAITQGDPLGVGPEVILKSLLSLSRSRLSASPQFKVFGEQRVFAELPQYRAVSRLKNVQFEFFETVKGKARFTPRKAGRSAWQSLDRALDAVFAGEAQSLATAPLCKSHCLKAGFEYPGHTDYLRDRCQVDEVVMMLASPKLRVALSTVHVPLGEVCHRLNQSQIVRQLQILETSLHRCFGVKRVRLAMAGVNPHAGEDGVLGDEEKTLLKPALKRFEKKRQYKSTEVYGPLPADTVFYQASQGQYDVVLSPYHDQGLSAVKTLDFARAVNLTLGLSFVRTSPDHGTAFDIAGQNKADATSMTEALRWAIKLGTKVKRRKSYD